MTDAPRLRAERLQVGCGDTVVVDGLDLDVLDGRRIDRTPSREVAKVVGVLPQNPVGPGRAHGGRSRRAGPLPAPVLVPAVVVGRRGRGGAGAGWTGMSAYADRTLETLSGGQRQRVWISMVLAQGTDVVLLDEPTTFRSSRARCWSSTSGR